MKKFFLRDLCLTLTLVMATTIFAYATSSSVVIYKVISEQNPVDNTHSDLKVTAFSASTELTPENGKYSQSGTVDVNENVAIGFKFNANNIQDVDNVVYTTSFKIHDDMGVDVTASLIRKSGTIGKHVLTFKKLNTGVRIYDATSNNTKYIDSSYSDGKAPCTVSYNAKTSVVTVQAGDKILTINDVAPESDAQYTTLRCKIGVSTTASGGAPEKFTVSDVSMKMEEPHEYEKVELYGIISKQSPVDNTSPNLKVTAFSATTELTPENSKYSQSGTVDVNENVAIGFKFNTSNIQDVNNVIYTTSFKIYDDMGVNVTASLIRKSGTPGVSVLTFKKYDGFVRIHDATNGNKTYIDSPFTDGAAPCTVTYNAKTKVLTAQADDKILTINDVDPEVGTEYTTLRCKISDSKTGDGVESERFTVSDVSMKLEGPNRFMGSIAENNNITEAAKGDLQVIRWNGTSMECTDGKFVLTAENSGNRGIILGLPKNSELKDTVDMTKVVYTASFKLHKEDRGGDFGITVLGYDSDSVEPTNICFKNEEKDGKLWVTWKGGDGTTAWNADNTVDCIITYNAATKVVTLKAGEIEASVTLLGDYIDPNAAAAYGVRIQGPTNVATTFSISDVSLKLEQPVKLMAAGNMVSMPLYKPTGGSDKMIFASYSDDNVLESVEIKDVAEWTSENITNKRFDITTSLTGNVRIFLWNDFKDIKPLVPVMEFNF